MSKKKITNLGIDETGHVYGHLTVLRRGEYKLDSTSGRRRVTWVCICDCPDRTEITIRAELLRSGSTGSCGCVTKRVDETGNTYGKLTVLNYAGLNKSRQVMWTCQCACDAVNSKQVTTLGSSLRAGSVRSCGCITSERLRNRPPRSDDILLPRRFVAMRAAFTNMKQNAAGRGIAWCIPDDMLEHLCSQNCFYSGHPPSNQGAGRHKGVYLYSGIDRIDNARGYYVDNVVPCCRTCNVAKGEMSMAEFVEHNHRVSGRFVRPARR